MTDNVVELQIPMKKEGTCSICGGPYERYGNNPWPVVENVNARCCDGCNSRMVIPARLEMVYNKKK